VAAHCRSGLAQIDVTVPTVSVVMPTYRRRHVLAHVLAPLLADPVASEIVVVVDGSRDGSYELLVDLAAGDPRLKPHLIENRGKEGARQAGVERASGEVVLLLDDDVLAAPGLVGGHARHHAEREGIVVLGYMPVRLPERRTAGNGATFLYAREYETRSREYEQDPGLVLRKLWGGNVSLRRADALRVGFRSAGYTAGYHQDREFGLRCLDAGLEGRFDRDLAAVHLHERSVDAFVRDARAQGRGLRQLHELHRAELGPLDERRFVAGLPRPLRAWVNAARRPRVSDASSWLLRALAAGLGRARAFGMEAQALRLLRRMEQQAGALEGSR
jgi:glycosyltransferase involved in cell wall biosynthesis